MQLSLPNMFASFRNISFRYLWASICLNGYSNHVSTVALSWLALEYTGSPLGVGLVIASRNLPRLFLAIPLGMLSDRLDRRVLLQATNYFGAAMSVLAAFGSLSGWIDITVIIGLAVMVGIFDVAETTLSKAFVYDVVGRKVAVNGMAMEQLANKLFGIVGAISSGVLLAVFGGVGAFSAMGAAYFISALILQAIPRNSKYLANPDSLAFEQRPGLKLKFYPIMLNLLRNPSVLLFASIALAAEVFAYSSEVLLPSFARDILAIGEVGLGALVALRSAGGVVGLLGLAGLASRVDAEKLLLITAAGFGLGLMLFAVSPSYLVAGATMLLVGAAWAILDALMPTVMQRRVSDGNRGAVVGVWNLGRGFGPVGQLEIGALGGIVGVALTQMVNGAIFFVIVVAVAALFYRFGQGGRPEAVN